MKQFGGTVLFLDRSDINTDEIIPAKYLNEISREDLRPHLLEDLALPGFDRAAALMHHPTVIVTRANFGCGSSREHAPWALEVNGITLVIAESFARIFRQNMFNCGLPAIEVPAAGIEELFALRGEAMPVHCRLAFDTDTLVFTGAAGSCEIRYALSAFDRDLVRSEGWVAYADSRY